MFEKGPGEGYRAAKAAALEIDPSLHCERYFGGYGGGGTIKGYVIYRDGKVLVSAGSSREAWNKALARLSKD